MNKKIDWAKVWRAVDKHLATLGQSIGFESQADKDIIVIIQREVERQLVAKKRKA